MAVKRSRKTRKAARKIKIARKPAGQRGKIIKSSNLKSDHDPGKLTLRPYFDAKRKAKQGEIKEYEKKYLSRYKKPRPKKKVSKQFEPESKPKRDIKKERKDYERKYVSRSLKLNKTKLKIAALEQKLRLSQIELEEPKRDIKKERKDYEKEYLTRYNKQKKAKPKKKVLAIR